MSTSGRGKINLTFPNSVRSNSGEYHCSIEGSRQQYPGVTNLFVYWIEMVNLNNSTEQGFSNAKMMCRYGPADMPLTGYKWKKIKKDGTTEIEDCSKDSRFEVTSYQNSILSLKIKKAKLKDAGKYQCEVTPVDGGQILKDTTQLTIEKVPLIMEIPTIITRESVNYVKLILKLTNVKNYGEMSNVMWYKHIEGKENKLLTSINSPDSTSRYQCGYVDESSAYLEIRNVKSGDEGKYICQVEFKEMEQHRHSCSGRLTVQGKSRYTTGS
ncbi:neural cell adhesion molecule 2-like [Antedon mediterranea]|uniref:neural cell adhesion molecule 2-like n=1 Tax=Antedon mediterranea TaxID=105859 RepID=UPI003AF90D88